MGPRAWSRQAGRFGLLAALAAQAPTALPQESKELHQQAQVWLSLNSTTRLSDRWGAVGDFHLRRTGFVEDPSFYFLRFGGHYWLRESLTLTAGYARTWNAPTCDGCGTWSQEDRIYQQLQFAARLGRTGLLLRLRNEQRWKDVVVDDAATGERAFSDRVRSLVSLSFPLSESARAPALVLSDEILLQFGSGVALGTFDQNRLFAGVKRGLGRSWSLDLGYMLVYQEKVAGYQYDLNHTLRCFFYFTPDLRGRPPSHEPASHEE